jgi:hypothetical protein
VLSCLVMTQEPDYTNLSLVELRQIERYINRELVPERWERLQAAIKVRLASRKPVGPSYWSSIRAIALRLERGLPWPKIIAIAQGSVVPLALVTMVLTLTPKFFAWKLAVETGVVAGYAVVAAILLWQEKFVGVVMSLFLQAAQCVTFKVFGISYQVIVGPAFPVQISWGGGSVRVPDFGCVAGIGRTSNSTTQYVAFNLVAVIATIVLVRRVWQTAPSRAGGLTPPGSGPGLKAG